jgi:hypothetical protein
MRLDDWALLGHFLLASISFIPAAHLCIDSGTELDRGIWPSS